MAVLKTIGLVLLIAGTLFTLFLTLGAIAAVMISSELSQLEEKRRQQMRDEDTDA